ncbi:MAG: acyl-CoA reductase [Flavobacteriales bacterium]|nr:acyl-CoA reductase [Flavobacteriales bacterium]
MNLKERIQTFVDLGVFLKDFKEGNDNLLSDEFEKLRSKIHESEVKNNWFTKDSTEKSLLAISNQLTQDNINSWLTPYNLSDIEEKKKVLLVMAGNIPLVGFHDFLSVVIGGNIAVVKLSSNDNVLFTFLWKVICKINPDFSDRLDYIDNIKERKFDAVIATGSDNSAKYFEYYFKNIRRIIRKNRRSIAVLNGKESNQELQGLADDVFLYFGLGCRSVSKVFLPKGYNLDKLFDVFFPFKEIVNHKKYGNNYDYNKAIFLMGGHNLTENGFLLMKEDNSLQSPVSMLFYEFYEDLDKVKDYIDENADLLQCVVCKEYIVKKNTHFGETQKPQLWDYADNVDTIEFLTNL